MLNCGMVSLTSSEYRRKNLEVLTTEWERRGGKLVDLAELLGLSPSYFSQLRSGARGIGEQTARKIEAALGWPRASLDHAIGPVGILGITDDPPPHWPKWDDVSPDLANVLVFPGPHVSPTGSGPPELAPSIKVDLRPISVWDDPSDLPPDQTVILPRLEFQLSAGHGGPDPDAAELCPQGAAFRAGYAKAKGWRPKTHMTYRARGYSMEPTIQDGAPVVVATNDREVRSGKIYALLIDGEPMLKRLDRLPGGRVRVRSDNPAPEFAPYEVDDVDLEVIGRVVWTASEL